MEVKIYLDLSLKTEDRGSGSLAIVPTNLKITKFGASTRKSNKLSANISVSAGITYVNRSPIQGPIPITELVVPIASANYIIGETSNMDLNNQRSNLIPNLSDRPVDLLISLTEIGNGAGLLSNGLEGFDKNAEVLRSILGHEE